MKTILSISKGFYIMSTAFFLVKEFESIGSVHNPDMNAVVIVFYLATAILSFFSISNCFAPIKPAYDLSIIFPELKPLQRGVFTSIKMRRFILIWGELSSIFIYLSIFYYVLCPSLEAMGFVALSFLPLALFSFLKIFIPKQVITQGLTNIFPSA
jgi:hypothetical protein